MCTINKSDHTKNNSGNLSNDPRIYISSITCFPELNYIKKEIHSVNREKFI